MGNQELFRRIYMKMELSSQCRDMLLLVMSLQSCNFKIYCPLENSVTNFFPTSPSSSRT